MALPFFYIKNITEQIITLDEDTSKHMIGVLRMQKGEKVLLTDGKGAKATAFIIDENRKRCSVQIESREREAEKLPKISIAVSLIKNTSRFEWLLEKITEIGVNEIIPLICERTEKSMFRYDRMHGILVSAMLQSQQAWLPVLHLPASFETIIKQAGQKQKFIAHCLPENKVSLADQLISQSTAQLILIGPEGDFTPPEIHLALQQNFTPVALGKTRLRTETAGIVATTLLRFFANGN